MKWSLVTAALAWTVPAATQDLDARAGPPDPPNDKVFPVDYRIMTFTEDRCRGNNVVHHKFNCSLECFPTEGIRSILIRALAYEELPWFLEDDERAFGGSNPVVNYDFIARDGPMAMVYGDNECSRSAFQGRAHLQRDDFETCITFEGTAYAVQAVFQRFCRDDEQMELLEAARTRNDQLTENDWFNPDESEGMEQALNWHYYEGQAMDWIEKRPGKYDPKPKKDKGDRYEKGRKCEKDKKEGEKCREKRQISVK